MATEATESPLLGELPRWVKQRTRHANLLSNGRVRIALIAAACILMGYALTSSLSRPGAYHGTAYPVPDDSEILDGSSGYGGDDFTEDSRIGVPHSTASEQLEGSQLGSSGGKDASIKGALSDLHHAVSGKLSSLTSQFRNGMTSHNVSHSGVFSDYETYNSTSPSSGSGLSGSRVPTAETVVEPGRDMLGARQRVGKVTIIFGGAAIYERAVRTHEAHDKIHGYPLYVLRHGIMDDVWSKPAYILNLLLRELSKPEAERLDWLLWVDADTILLNPHIPIETFLPPSPEFDDVHMLVTRDWNGLNNGVFPVRVSQWAVDLFAAIVSFRYYRPKASLTFRDQSAMDALIQEPKFAAHIAWAPQRWFNAYQGEHNETLAPFQVRRGDFLVHFAGVGDRTERMTYWLDRVEQHLPDWEMEVQHTSYPGEAREFWGQQRQGRSDAARGLVQAKKEAMELLEKTETQLSEYQSRLQEAEVQSIRDKMKLLREKVDLAGVDAVMIGATAKELENARTPLDAVTAHANKALLKEAHEAIFSAEKALLTMAGSNEKDVARLEEKTGHLKHMVLQPTWSKVELVQAIDDVKRGRAGLEQNEQKAEAQITPEQATRVAALEKQLHEADLAKAELLRVEPSPAAAVVAPDEPLIIDGVLQHFVTHTATAIEMTTSIVMEMVTMTVDPNPNK